MSAQANGFAALHSNGKLRSANVLRTKNRMAEEYQNNRGYQ